MEGDSWKLKACLALLTAIIPVFIGLTTYVVRDVRGDIERVERSVTGLQHVYREVKVIQVQRIEQFELMLVRVARFEVKLDELEARMKQVERDIWQRYRRFEQEIEP